MSEIYKHFEPESEARAEQARQKAERIYNGNYDDYGEALLFLQWIIARHYGMPIFDPYFELRTLDDLVFEAEMIRLATLPPTQAKSEVVNSNKKEAEGLFDDWEDVEMAPPNDDNFSAMAENFMKNDKFTTE